METDKPVVLSTSLKPGDLVYVRTSATMEETGIACQVVTSGAEGEWLRPVQRGSASRLVSGQQLSVIVSAKHQALLAPSTVLHIRRDRLATDLLVTKPVDWQLLVRRNRSRSDVQIDARLYRMEPGHSTTGRRSFPAQLVNLSATGARVVSRVPLMQDEILAVQFELGGQEGAISVIGQVARLITTSQSVVRAYEFGVRFLKPRAEDRERIESFVTERNIAHAHKLLEAA